MSMSDINTTAKSLIDVRAMIAEPEAEAEALTDKLKAAMVEQGQETLTGDGWRATEEREQQPVRQQELQGRPRRPVQPVQQGHHHDPVCSQCMRKAACQTADQST